MLIRSNFSSKSKFPLCSLCNELVELKTSKTDEKGKSIHEECYVKAVGSRAGMLNCEENHRLLKLVADEWDRCDQIKKLFAFKGGEERTELESELKDAFWSATRLSAKQNEHVKTCLICSTPSVQ